MNRQAQVLPRYFYRTAAQPCPYLSGRVERNVFAELGGDDVPAVYDILVRHGFRRSHNIVYRPDCPACAACVPIRVVARDFLPRRSLRRVLRVNRDLLIHETPALATVEQHRLFGRYLSVRHDGGEMLAMSFADYRAMVETSLVESFVAEFREPSEDLVGVCLVDRLSDGLSAVYSYFAPDVRCRSLGTQMILWLIQRTREAALPYTYLGYWIATSPKMAYKARFQPLERFGPQGWRLMHD